MFGFKLIRMDESQFESQFESQKLKNLFSYFFYFSSNFPFNSNRFTRISPIKISDTFPSYKTKIHKI